MQNTKRIIRNLMIDYRFHFILRYINRHKTIIIMYHTFSQTNNSLYNNVSIDIKTFEKQLIYLKKYYHVLPLKEIVNKLINNEKLPKYSVAITFDDGYKSNYKLAYPLIKKYNLHATIFLTSDYMANGKWLWVNELEYIIKNTRVESIDIPMEKEIFRLELGVPESRGKVYTILKEKMKRLPHKRLLTIMDYLEAHLGVSLKGSIVPNYEMLSWEDIFQMDDKYIDFGCHTATHALLPMIEDQEVLKKEIIKSKFDIEQALHKKIDLFCYPNGEFNGEAISLLKQHYIAAVSTRPGYVGEKYDIFDLPRIDADEIRDFKWALVRYVR